MKQYWNVFSCLFYVGAQEEEKKDVESTAKVQKSLYVLRALCFLCVKNRF